MAKKTSPYRAMYRLRQGDLHKHLGMKDDEDFNDEKLDEASKSDNEHLKHMANFMKAHRGSKK